jgi:hypothetical protein
MSFMAVLSILIFYPIISVWWKTDNKVFNWIWQLAAVSIAAQIGTAPLVCYYFGRISCYFLLTNYFVIPAATVVLYFSVALFVCYAFPAIASLIANVLIIIVSGMNTCLSWISTVNAYTEELLDLYTITKDELDSIYAVMALKQYSTSSDAMAILLAFVARLNLNAIQELIVIFTDLFGMFQTLFNASDPDLDLILNSYAMLIPADFFQNLMELDYATISAIRAMLLKSTLDSVALKNSSLVTLGSLSTETATLNTANGILMTTVAVRNQNAQLESSISSIEQSTYLLDSYSSQMTAMEPRLQAGDLNTVSSFSSLVDSSALEVANINTNSALISTSSSTQVSNLTTLNKSISMLENLNPNNILLLTGLTAFAGSNLSSASSLSGSSVDRLINSNSSLSSLKGLSFTIPIPSLKSIIGSLLNLLAAPIEALLLALNLIICTLKAIICMIAALISLFADGLSKLSSMKFSWDNLTDLFAKGINRKDLKIDELSKGCSSFAGSTATSALEAKLPALKAQVASTLGQEKADLFERIAKETIASKTHGVTDSFMDIAKTELNRIYDELKASFINTYNNLIGLADISSCSKMSMGLPSWKFNFDFRWTDAKLPYLDSKIIKCY